MEKISNKEVALKIGTIDGISFEKSRSHHLQSQRGGYNNLRSHGYMITQLASELGCDTMYSTTDSGNTGNNLHPGDDLNYTFLEFNKMKFEECTHGHPTKYGILVQTLVDTNYIHRLHDFVDSVDHLFIYSSDYEYELRKNTFNLKFLFEFMRDPGEHLDLVEKIKKKLVVAYCGWYHIAKYTKQVLGINTEFIPQVINPNIPLQRKGYDEKPYDGFFMGMNERNIEFMQKSDNKHFLSIQYRDYSVDHKDYRNVTQIQQAGICTDLISLLTFTSLCKFHCITNSWKNLYPQLEQNSDMIFNQTFKIFEAYYGGMYPINPAQNWDAALTLMNCNRDQWTEMWHTFEHEFEKNYSYLEYMPTLLKSISKVRP